MGWLIHSQIHFCITESRMASFRDEANSWRTLTGSLVQNDVPQPLVNRERDCPGKGHSVTRRDRDVAAGNAGLLESFRDLLLGVSPDSSLADK